MAVDSDIHAFFAALADAAGVPHPRVNCDVPLPGEAQYSPVRKEIQFSDGEFLRTLTESGSSAPLRWGLHEFAHHIQYCSNGQEGLSESGAIEFTNAHVGQLMPIWERAVIESATITIPAAVDYTLALE